MPKDSNAEKQTPMPTWWATEPSAMADRQPFGLSL